MDTSTRDNARKRSGKIKSHPVYFFLDDELYRKLHTNKAADLLIAYKYSERRTVGLPYILTTQNMKAAFTTASVAKMINRSRETVQLLLIADKIHPRPPMTHGFKEGMLGHQNKYMWSEDHIMALHDYMKNVHRGRPRKDGFVTSSNLPSARELRAIIRQEVVLYVQNDKGEFIPTWAAKGF